MYAMGKLSIAAAALLTLALDSRSADEKPNPLAPIARFIGGEWRINGHWDSGEALRARNVYEWGPGKKVIIGKTFVTADKGEYQRYMDVYTYCPDRKAIAEFNFSFQGGEHDTVIDVIDADTLKFGWRDEPGHKPSNIRQTLHFSDNDHFVWTVEMKSQNGEWKRLIEGNWERVAN